MTGRRRHGEDSEAGLAAGAAGRVQAACPARAPSPRTLPVPPGGAVHCHVSQGRSPAASPSRALTRASGLPAQPGSRSPGGLGPRHPGVSSASRSAEHRAGRQAACKCRQGRRTLRRSRDQKVSRT